MKTLIVFDCYQTLIYKKGLELAIKRFIDDVKNVSIDLLKIKNAKIKIYNKHKLNHPVFKSKKDREKFYIGYNKDFLKMVGLEISDDVAFRMNKALESVKYACYDDVLAALKYLKNKNYSLGLLANWTQSLKKILEDLDISKYFDFIYSSHELGVQKPNIDFFKKSLGKMVNEYEKVYYIGDDYDLDILPAKYAGLIPILIDRNDDNKKADNCKKIKSMVELMDLF